MLEMLQAEARKHPGWEQYADYCKLRIQGNRADSTEVLKQFVQSSAAWNSSEKQEFIVWLLEHLQDYPITSQCPAFDEPIKTDLIHPFLKNWSKAYNNDARPFRWLGMFFDDESTIDYLKKAIEVDSKEQLARGVLLGKYFDRLWSSTQYVDDGRYVGNAKEDLRLVETSYDLLTQVDDEATRKYWTLLLNDKKSKIEQWLSSTEAV